MLPPTQTRPIRTQILPFSGYVSTEVACTQLTTILSSFCNMFAVDCSAKIGTNTFSGNNSGCLENILRLKSLYLHCICKSMFNNQHPMSKEKIPGQDELSDKKGKKNVSWQIILWIMKPYVPTTLVILSIARSLICDASKYLSSSARVLQGKTESRPLIN